MIIRIWRGWTDGADADAYEALLRNEVFPGIEGRNIDGYRSISLGRRNTGAEVEFVTIMWFESIESVIAFAGADYATAVVPPKARALLSHFDATSAHYETIVPPTL